MILVHQYISELTNYLSQRARLSKKKYRNRDSTDSKTMQDTCISNMRNPNACEILA